MLFCFPLVLFSSSSFSFCGAPACGRPDHKIDTFSDATLLALRKEEEQFRVAAENGFDPACALGQKFGRMVRAARKAGSDEFADYEGTNLAKARWRQKWAARKYTEIVEKRTKTESWNHTSFKNITYRNVDQLLDVEGRSPAGRQGVARIIKKCLLMGFPWWKRAEQSDRIVFGHIEEGFSRTFNRQWALYKERIRIQTEQPVSGRSNLSFPPPSVFRSPRGPGRPERRTEKGVLKKFDLLYAFVYASVSVSFLFVSCLFFSFLRGGGGNNWYKDNLESPYRRSNQLQRRLLRPSPASCGVAGESVAPTRRPWLCRRRGPGTRSTPAPPR